MEFDVISTIALSCMPLFDRDNLDNGPLRLVLGRRRWGVQAKTSWTFGSTSTQISLSSFHTFCWTCLPFSDRTNSLTGFA